MATASERHRADRPRHDRQGSDRQGSDRQGSDRQGSERRRGESPRTPRPQGPSIPEDISWFDLDREARASLRSLPKAIAEKVGAHLAAAGMLIDEDPEAARLHTDEARRMAGRVATVREACALTAYACGDYEAALTELRAYRRLSGDQHHLPLMADCERGLGRPERAIELAATPEAQRLPPEVARELLIVVAGARSDLGQHESAVVLLEADPALRRAGDGHEHSIVRLRYAYADALERVGRDKEAQQWFARVADEDGNSTTDAAERAASISAIADDASQP
jgi:hypothetical protein